MWAVFNWLWRGRALSEALERNRKAARALDDVVKEMTRP